MRAADGHTIGVSPPTCARCHREVERMDQRWDGDVAVFVARCHGRTEETRLGVAELQTVTRLIGDVAFRDQAEHVDVRC